MMVLRPSGKPDAGLLAAEQHHQHLTETVNTIGLQALPDFDGACSAAEMIMASTPAESSAGLQAKARAVLRFFEGRIEDNGHRARRFAWGRSLTRSLLDDLLRLEAAPKAVNADTSEAA